MRPSPERTWLDVAATIARRSTCLRRHVGCVLTNARGHVLATGYNGRAAGLPHCNEERYAMPGKNEHVNHFGDLTHANIGYTKLVHPYACAGATSPSGTNLDGCEAIHAEANALLQCRDVWQIDTAYVTVSPCVPCVKLLLNTSCQRIVFAQPYAAEHVAAARELWLRGWIDWSTVKEE